MRDDEEMPEDALARIERAKRIRAGAAASHGGKANYPHFVRPGVLADLARTWLENGDPASLDGELAMARALVTHQTNALQTQIEKHEAAAQAAEELPDVPGPSAAPPSVYPLVGALRQLSQIAETRNKLQAADAVPRAQVAALLLAVRDSIERHIADDAVRERIYAEWSSALDSIR